MSFCANCGREVPQGNKFCAGCGAPVEAAAPVTPVEPVTPVAPVSPYAYQNVDEQNFRDEQDFLETTHRILRWEHKAWTICGKVFTIMGIVLAALFFTLSFIFLFAGSEELFGAYFSLTFSAGITPLALGIVATKAAEKIPQYLDCFQNNYRMANDRCGNVGMLIFEIFCGSVAFVFFLINFIRIKSNGEIVERILARQGAAQY